MKFQSILVVCVGNICRSPTGAALLKKSLPMMKISSAGIGAMVGHPADETASLVAKNNGISLEGHIAQQLSSALCHEYDLILVMEKRHLEAVSKISPAVRGKTMLFGHWLSQREIDDPYRKSQEAFEHVFQLLLRSADKWTETLTS